MNARVAAMPPVVEAQPRVSSARPAGRSKLRRALRWLEHVFAIVGVCFVASHFLFEYEVMVSDSMSPALKGTAPENGDRVLVEKVTPHFRAPHRWDIYYFYDSEGTPVAKRVLGLPGERISVRNNKVCINGVELAYPDHLKSLKHYALGDLITGREIDCGAGYFMLGDNSIDSWDSRFLGAVRPERFIGRVWLIIGPRSRFGFAK